MRTLKKYIVEFSENELDGIVDVLTRCRREHQAVLFDHETGILKRSCFELDSHRAAAERISCLLDKIANADMVRKRKSPKRTPGAVSELQNSYSSIIPQKNKKSI